MTIKNTTRQKNFFFVSVAVLRIARIGKYFHKVFLKKLLTKFKNNDNIFMVSIKNDKKSYLLS